MSNTEKFCQLGRSVIALEARAVAELAERLDQHFAKACECLLACLGRIVVIGMGKSGHIANKIAATLASTGSPAFFVHPAEASHGDLGMITQNDVVLAISYSGETAEVLTILPLLKRLNVPLVALTGNPKSALAEQATVHLDVSVSAEACPLGLAPTASTTAALAMGDALAVALLEARGFTAEDFAYRHPGGSLGRRLLWRVSDLMRRGEAVPKVHEQTKLSEALIEVSKKGLGMTCVVNEQGQLVGVFTDGDLRRAVDQGISIYATPIAAMMSSPAKTIKPDVLAAAALRLMEEAKITALVIVDNQQVPDGVLHLHDLLRVGMS